MTDEAAWHQRDGGPPMWTGDHVDGLCVTGFALARDPGPADQVLVAGDEKLSAPPYRPMPATGNRQARVERTGPPPDDRSVVRLPPDMAHDIGEGLDRQLFAMGEAGDFIRKLLDHIDAEEHRAWLVGGAVRDLIALGPAARPADLDFTGTIGPGELYDAIRRWRRAAGMADYRPFISPQLVCAVAPPGGNRPDAFVEYKPLSQPGFCFPAWGGTLARDAATRDLTVNALYFDRANRVVADPTGRGVPDLMATPRIAATPYRGDDPVDQACVILRCLKFRFRWPELNIAEISAWAAGLPPDLASCIPEERWRFLTGLRRRSVPERHRGADELSVAREFGPAALSLIEQIHAQREAGC
jgi:hypothetical protein